MHLENLLRRRPRVMIIMGMIMVCMIGAVGFFRLPYMSYTGDRIVFTPLEIDISNLDFAGETLPVDPLDNPHGREKIESELLTTHLSLYQFLLFHKASSQYFPFMESYFRDVGIPDDFKYLAIAESSLRPAALSEAGAAGIWQFMPETAKRYGLRVDDLIDERYDFEKSTPAAAAYLLHLYEEFGSWTMVAAAYNRGESGLKRHMEEQPTAKTYYDLVLNAETGNYLYRIIAIKYLMQNRFKLFSSEMLGQVWEIPSTKILTIDGPVTDLRVWSLERDIDYQELRELNPWIRTYSLPSGVWDVDLLVR